MLDAFARPMIYPAPPVQVPSPPPPPLAEVALDLATGERVVGWAHAGAGLAPSAPVALFFHGNGENLATLHWAGLFGDLADLGIALLVVDYPGYGRSTGTPSEEGLVATGDAAVAWALARHPGRPVAVCGWSLGAAVAIAAAARQPAGVAGLVGLSAWTTLADVARLLFPSLLVKGLLRERYDSLALAPGIRVPALVVHGEEDELIPVEQGRRIAAALGGPTRWVPVPGAGHNDLLAQPVVWEELRRFFAGLAPDS
jgi:uncharacterized protein